MCGYEMLLTGEFSQNCVRAANKYDWNYFAGKADKHLKYLGAIKQTRTFPTSLITYSLKSACSTVVKQKTNARP